MLDVLTSLRPDEMASMFMGLLTLAVLFYCNRHLYLGGAGGRTSFLEAFYYVVAVAALGIGWYFNFQYMRQYQGVSGWWHWTTLLFVNPASASGGQDLIFANLILFPLWTIIDGRRRRMKVAWLYFPMSLVTSYALGVALFLAIQERQLRYLERAPGAAA